MESGRARATPAADPLLETARSAFGALEAVPPGRLDAPEVTLGRALFWDRRLSRDGKTACANCHTRDAWGSDPRPSSPDARGALTGRHSQTVFNVTAQPTGVGHGVSGRIRSKALR